jgi:hypothetical protein
VTYLNVGKIFKNTVVGFFSLKRMNVNVRFSVIQKSPCVFKKIIKSRSKSKK